jgi:hypothetical protein
MIRSRSFIAAAALLVAGCSATPRPAPEPRVVTVEVAVPVASPCVPKGLAAAPTYPDSNEALRAATDAANRYALLAAGRLLRVARLNELEGVVAGCPREKQ